jgi:leucyl-tRNA synthetase
VMRLIEAFAANGAADGDLHLRLRYKTIRKVTSDIEALKFNTAIAALMEYVNELGRAEATREDLVALVKLLAPFAPHLADEAWEMLGERGFALEAAWPRRDEALASEEDVTLAVQVNGKLRGTLQAARATPEVELRARALALPAVARHLENRAVRKVVVVPGKVVSVVTD